MVPDHDPGSCEVSVIIPTRNRRRFLSQALASVLDQRGVRLEVIVVDDGSTDDTAAAVGSIGDPRVRLIRHDRPVGAAGARNRGIEEATGEWVAFLDDDDLWAPDKLRLQLDVLRSTGRVWAYTGAVNITADHRVLGGAPPRPPDEVAASLRQINCVPGGASSVMVRKSALPPGGFDATCRLVPDWDLWIRLAREGPPAAVAKPLVGYRVHDGNASLDTATYLAELEMMEARYGGPVDRVTYYRYLARVCLRMSRQWMACRFYAMAARRDRAYRSRQLAPDLVEVLRSSLDRVRGRLGRPRRPASRQQATDPHLAWKEEARGWLDQFTSRHAA